MTPYKRQKLDSVITPSIILSTSNRSPRESTTTSKPDDDISHHDFTELPSTVLLSFQSHTQRHSIAYYPLHSNNPYLQNSPFGLPFLPYRMLVYSFESQSDKNTRDIHAHSLYEINEELEKLVKNNTMRRIKMLHNSRDPYESYILMETKYYKEAIKDALFYPNNYEMKNMNYPLRQKIWNWLLGNFQYFKQFYVTYEKLLDKKLISRDIKLLCDYGLLIPRDNTREDESYWWTLPQLGKTIRYIKKGNEYILQKIKNSYYGELERKVIEQLPFSKNVRMNGSFHLKDMLSKGQVKIVCRHGNKKQFIVVNDKE